MNLDAKNMQSDKKVNQPVVMGNIADSNRSGLRRFVPQSRIKILVSIAIFLLLVALVWIKIASVAFTVDGKSYSKSDVNSVVAVAAKHKVPRTNAIETYIDYAKEVNVADKMQLKPAASDTEAIAQTKYHKTTATLDRWEMINTTLAAIQNELLYKQYGDYEGYYYLFPFDQRTVSPPGVTNIPKFGDPAAIAADKENAHKKAVQALNERKKNTVSAADIIKRISADRDLATVGSSNNSGPYRVNQLGYHIVLGGLSSTSLSAYIVPYATADKVGISGLITQQKDYPYKWLRAPGYEQPTDAMYFFVEITKAIKPDPKIEKQFKDYSSKLKVVSHV